VAGIAKKSGTAFHLGPASENVVFVEGVRLVKAVSGRQLKNKLLGYGILG
jgi:hypothetical protein